MGLIISLQCKCGFNDEVYTGDGRFGLAPPNDYKKYFVYDKRKKKLIAIKSYERIEIDGFISEIDIINNEKIICPSCNSKTLESDMAGLWD